MKFNPRQPLKPLLNAVEALPGRDRAVLLVAGLAVAAAADWFVVWPMHQQRDGIVAAAVEEAQAAADASAQAAGERQQADAALQARAQALQADLARLGMNHPRGQPLGELVAQALKPQTVRVASLRELDVEEMQARPAPGAEPVAAPDTTVVADETDAQRRAAAVAPAVLYRHRFELRLAGDVPALLAAAAALEQQARPLRIERMRMASSDGVAVELTLTLAVLGTERAWLAL